MTVSSENNRNGPYLADGVNPTFGRTFLALDADHIKVYRTSDGVTTEVTTGITKTNIGDQSGNVIFDIAPASGVEITLILEVPNLQETDYSNQGTVEPEQVERDLDLAAMRDLSLSERIGRSFTAPVTGKSFTPGNVASFDDEGNIIDGPSAAEISQAQGYAQEAAEAAAAVEPYPDRATAIAATVVASVRSIRIKTPSDYILNYAETDAADLRVALTTNGGTRYWAPADLFVSPQHYAENTTPGTTDLIDALDAMAAGIAHSVLAGVAYPDYTALYRGARSGAPRLVSLLGEPVAISRPWILGALDTDLDGVFNVGPGAIYGLKLAFGRLVALDGFDATPLATHNHPTEGVVTTVPAYAMVLGTYELTDKKTEQENVFYVDGVTVDSTFEIDCNFVTGGIYPTNTNRTTIDAPHIFNLGKNTMGIRTAVSDDVPTRNHIGNFNPMTGAPFPATGAQSKNPELRISRVSISGRNRQAGVSFPPGETDATMGTVGIGIYTADFHLDAPIVTATTSSIEFDMFRNAQFYASHTWSNNIIYGPDCENVITYGGYWDYTDIVMYSFKHPLVGCSWGAGSSNLRLVATTANEDADGLLITGCKFYNSSTINYGSEGGGSWVVPLARKHVISGGYSEAGNIPQLQIGDTLRLGADNALTFSHNGAPRAYIASSSDGFAIIPFDAGGSALLNDQLKFDLGIGSWSFGRDNAGSNGKGFAMRGPNGPKFFLSIDDAGDWVKSPL